MSEFGKFVADKVQLQKVDILSASIENPLEIANKLVEAANFNLGFNFGFNPDEKLVKLEFEVGLSSNIENIERQATCNFKLAFVFSIENLKELVHIEGDVIDGSEDMAFALSAIAYSTTRGILLTRLQGTIFRDFILPVISPSDLLNKSTQPES